MPGFPNDETESFLEVRTFATYGFRGGHFGVAEVVAPASFSRFSTHGPAFAILYGSLARLFGISYDLATFLNVAALTLALAVYYLLVRPGCPAMALLAAFFLTFWPFYFTVFSWMQDAFHIAVATLLAGLFGAILREPPLARRRVLFSLTFVILCGVSQFRVAWALLLPPLCVLAAGGRSVRGALLPFCAGCAAVLACWKLFQLICSPVRDFRGTFLMNKLVAGEAGLEAIREQVLSNLRGFHDLFVSGNMLSRTVVAQGLFVVFAVAIIALYRGIRRVSGMPSQDGAGRWIALVGYNQAAIMLATVAVYLAAGATRVFSPHLLLGLLVAASAPSRALRGLLPAALAANLLTSIPALAEVRDYHYDHFHYRASVEDFRKKIDGMIAFDPDGDGWDNTVLAERLPFEFVALPAGIGVEYYFTPDVLSRPVRSRYIIAAPDDVHRAGRRVRPLIALPGIRGGFDGSPDRGIPTLFLNLDRVPSMDACTADR